MSFGRRGQDGLGLWSGLLDLSESEIGFAEGPVLAGQSRGGL